MDVVELGEYYASPMGKATRRLIAARLKSRTGSLRDATVLGLGFTPPYLEEVSTGAGQTLAFMMARSGVIHWPLTGKVNSALVDELDLPLTDNSVDLALVVHALELTDSPVDMLQEIWRVLSPQGRLLLVVPSRHGLWASFDSSPFGYGQPFSRRQLGVLLKESQFSILSLSHALSLPPWRHKLVISSASALEKIGGIIAPRLSGVIIVEAVKQVYAFSAGKRARRFVPRFRPVFLPSPAQGRMLKSDSLKRQDVTTSQ